MQLVATCPPGLESVLAREIQGNGWESGEVTAGAVRFSGPNSLIADANLKLRTASRVLLPIRSGTPRSYEDVYRLASSIDWPKHIPTDKTFRVSASSSNRNLTDTRFLALKVKDAIADTQRRRTRRRSSVERVSPDIGVTVHADSRVEVSLDTSGKPLHMRGYRTESGDAPLRETLAAGLVLLSGWNARVPLIDPFCGSGTILIEAAMIAAGIYPGMLRDSYAFLRWPNADRGAFERRKAELGTTKRPLVPICGADNNPEMIKLAQRNAERAGVSSLVSICCADFFHERHPDAKPGSLLVCNPPYGERLDIDDAPDFYRKLGDELKQSYAGCTAWILSGNREAFKSLGLRPAARIPVFHGGLDARLYRIDLYARGSQQ